MRFSKIIEIIKVLFIFFHREVLSFGILQSKAMRGLALGVIVVLITVMTGIMDNFFSVNESTFEQTQIVLDTYSCSVFMYTFFAFLFIKILFIKKQTLLQFTQQMPVTRRELHLSILFFEMILSLILVATLSSAMVFSLIIRDGVVFALRLVCNVFFPCVISYLVFQLVYVGFSWICTIFQLKRIKDVLIICTLSACMFVFYVITIPHIFDSILFDYMDGNGTSGYLVFTVIMEKYGFLCSLAAFIAAVIVLVMLIVLWPNKDFLEPNRFIKGYSKGGRMSLFKGYTLAYLRNADTYSYYFIALFLCAMMYFGHIGKPYYAIAILPMNGIYAYIQTDDLRYILFQKDYSVVKDYALLICSQAWYVFLLGIPMMVTCVVTEESFFSLMAVLGTNFFEIILFTLSGILFPPKNENPFSVFSGLIIIFAISVILFIILMMLQIAEWMMLVIVCGILVFSVITSIIGLNKLKQIHRFG